MSSPYAYASAPHNDYSTSAFATDKGTVQVADDRRMRATIDARAHAAFPTVVNLNGIAIPICKFDELERLKFDRLKQKAFNLRDIIESTGSRFFQHNSGLTLRATGAEAIVAWFIAVQVTLCNALGYDFDASSFGAPSDENYQAPSSRSAVRVPAPCWSQPDLDERSHVNQQQSPAQHFQVKAPYAASEQVPQQSPAQHFQVKAPYAASDEYDFHPQEHFERPKTADRFHDAALIKARNNQGSFVLG